MLLLGVLELRGEADQVLARFPRVYWQPEGPSDESTYDAGRAADDAAAFAAATGLPVTDNRGPEHALAASRPGDEEAAVVSDRTALPLWFQVARVLAAVASAGLLIAILILLEWSRDLAGGRTYQALAVSCAAVVLAQPLMAGMLFARAFWLDRASGRALPAPVARLAPHPARPVTRRFLRNASLRLFPADLVATADDGSERWLPRSGPTGVVELARVIVDGRPTRLELRTADGRPRAVLPWHDWFAGAGGDQALAEFATAAGLPVREAEGRRISEGEETIARYRPLGSLPRSVAATILRWHGLPGPASLYIPVTYGVFSAIVGAGSPAAFAMSLGAVVATAGPAFALRFVRARQGRMERVGPTHGEAGGARRGTATRSRRRPNP